VLSALNANLRRANDSKNGMNAPKRRPNLRRGEESAPRQTPFALALTLLTPKV
jgi:hypothetical protein